MYKSILLVANNFFLLFSSTSSRISWWGGGGHFFKYKFMSKFLSKQTRFPVPSIIIISTQGYEMKSKIPKLDKVKNCIRNFNRLILYD